MMMMMTLLLIRKLSVMSWPVVTELYCHPRHPVQSTMYQEKKRRMTIPRMIRVMMILCLLHLLMPLAQRKSKHHQSKHHQRRSQHRRRRQHRSRHRQCAVPEIFVSVVVLLLVVMGTLVSFARKVCTVVFVLMERVIIRIV